jgi:hypothetical protein
MRFHAGSDTCSWAITICLTFKLRYLESDVVIQCKDPNGNLAGGELVLAHGGVASGAGGGRLGRGRGGDGRRRRRRRGARAGSTAGLRGG